VAAQFALTEGLPAAGLAIVSTALARAARRSAATVAAWAALIAGAIAALISLLQFGLGAVLAGTASPGTAHLLYDAVNRLDGVKMLTLAILGLAAAASGVLPRWLRDTGITLAIAITASGIAYLLLLQGLTVLAAPALVLLLLFITGTGMTAGAAKTTVGAAPITAHASSEITSCNTTPGLAEHTPTSLLAPRSRDRGAQPVSRAGKQRIMTSLTGSCGRRQSVPGRRTR
jgi:hypothetical protein